MRNVSLFSRSDLPYALEMVSDEFFAAWKEGRSVTDIFGRLLQSGGPISFCFIDGNHTFDFVKRDYENTDQFLESGGFLLFDDSHKGSMFEGVRKTAQKAYNSGKYRLVMENPNHLFVKR